MGMEKRDGDGDGDEDRVAMDNTYKRIRCNGNHQHTQKHPISASRSSPMLFISDLVTKIVQIRLHKTIFQRLFGGVGDSAGDQRGHASNGLGMAFDKLGPSPTHEARIHHTLLLVGMGAVQVGHTS